jgi:diguanylate cyclase (GGDEF)-like protein
VDYVTKPFQEKEVLARIQTHLALRQLQQDLCAANAELARQNDLLRERMHEIEALQSQLHEQAIRDALTGTFNRRYLEETLERELARAEREKYPLTIAMMDLDRFKLLNDTYGHAAGDLMLQRFARLIQEKIRKSDILCRYGGEEFVVLMPNAALPDAQRRAEQWRLACELMKMSYRDWVLGATISLGLSSNTETGLSSGQLLDRADQALYHAKSGGRNRVVIWQPSWQA